MTGRIRGREKGGIKNQRRVFRDVLEKRGVSRRESKSIKTLSHSYKKSYGELREAGGKTGGKNDGESGDVIENKWRKNVRKSASRDVIENKLVKITLWRC